MIVLVYTVRLTIGGVQVAFKLYHSVRFSTLSSNRRLTAINVKRLREGCKSRRNQVRVKPVAGWRPAVGGLRLENLRGSSVTGKNGKKYRQLTTVNSCNPLEDQQRHNHDTPPDSPILQKLDGIVNAYDEGPVSAAWGPQQLAVWLQANRYGPHIHTLSTYSGADLLRLSRDNLVQLCGLPDGIRLYNVLHAKPKLTLYICVDSNERVYQAIYMTCLTSAELVAKVSTVIGVHVSQVLSMYVEGPNGIKLVLNDQLVSHLNDHSAYSISSVIDGDRYQLLLKQSEHNPNA